MAPRLWLFGTPHAQLGGRREAVSPIKTRVIAFYRLQQGYDVKRSPAVLLDQKTLRDPYKLEGAEPGSYLVGAWQDVNGNGKLDEREPLGAYPNYVTVDSVSRSIVGIDIDLQPYTPSGAASAARAGTPAQNLADALRRSEQGKARQERF